MKEMKSIYAISPKNPAFLFPSLKYLKVVSPNKNVKAININPIITP